MTQTAKWKCHWPCYRENSSKFREENPFKPALWTCGCKSHYSNHSVFLLQWTQCYAEGEAFHSVMEFFELTTLMNSHRAARWIGVKRLPPSHTDLKECANHFKLLVHRIFTHSWWLSSLEIIFWDFWLVHYSGPVIHISKALELLNKRFKDQMAHHKLAHSNYGGTSLKLIGQCCDDPSAEGFVYDLSCLPLIVCCLSETILIYLVLALP